MNPPSPPTALVCLTGSELVRGETRDTNGAWLATSLTDLGFRVAELRTVPDDATRLASCFREALERVDLLVVSGGLGPTADDVTLAAMGEATGARPVRDPRTLRRLERLATERWGRPEAIPANFAKQAEVLEGARVLRNTEGLAPGTFLDAGGRRALVLPGVPRELRAVFREEAVPALREAFSLRPPRRLRLRVLDVPESVGEARIQALGLDLERTSYGISARPGELTLRFVARSDADAAYLDEVQARLEHEFGDALLPLPEELLDPDTALSQAVHELLLARDETVATAESCTSGLLAAALTEHPGSSGHFQGAVIAYQNRLKEELLGVPGELLARHGAVSEATARAMAEGVRRRLGTDWGLSVTGIAGPGGGSPDKPVGLVWFGLSAPDGQTVTSDRRFPGSRELVRTRSVVHGLDLLRRALFRRL